jgi:hypothetical protein
MLGLSSTALRNIIDSSAFIYEQAAYFGILPTLLQNLLAKTGLSSSKVFYLLLFYFFVFFF